MKSWADPGYCFCKTLGKVVRNRKNDWDVKKRTAFGYFRDVLLNEIIFIKIVHSIWICRLLLNTELSNWINYLSFSPAVSIMDQAHTNWQTLWLPHTYLGSTRGFGIPSPLLGIPGGPKPRFLTYNVNVSLRLINKK